MDVKQETRQYIYSSISPLNLFLILVYLLGFDRNPIKITLPDGAVKEGTSYESSPFTVAKGISSQLAKQIIVAKVRYTNKRV